MSQQQNQPNYEEKETGFEGLSESELMEVGLLAPTLTSTRGSVGTRSEVQGRGVLCLWLAKSGIVCSSQCDAPHPMFFVDRGKTCVDEGGTSKPLSTAIPWASTLMSAAKIDRSKTSYSNLTKNNKICFSTRKTLDSCKCDFLGQV